MTAVDREQTERALAALQHFWNTPLDDLLPPRDGQQGVLRVESALLRLLSDTVRDVPAYRAFLAERGVRPEQVRSLADFRCLPTTSKQNYHQRFELAQLCRQGRLRSCDMLAVSSGSTGQPTIWPRFVSDEVQTAVRFEQVLVDTFRVDSRRTLGVVCFALGSWVGGMFTTACLRHIAAKGYPLTVVTPGNQKTEILRVLTALQGQFEQVVLFGYPPFLKDVIDWGAQQGFDWSAANVRLVLAGEVFSEEWRSLVCERLGADDPTKATASLYGTADAGVLATETVLSVRLRRALAERPELALELFGQARLPTLCQYDPAHRYFEVQQGSLLFSGDSGVPLLRYEILDQGGVLPYQDVLAFASRHGLDLGSETERRAARPMPFVYVFGRSNFAVSFYGANVYPENIAVGLERAEFAAHLTGKFVLESVNDSTQAASLRVSVELAPGREGDVELADQLAATIRTQLERLNSEFANYVPEERKLPVVVFKPAGDPGYFPLGVKHRYTR